MNMEQAEKVDRYEEALKEIKQYAVYYDNKGWAVNADKVVKIVDNALKENGVK